MKNPSRWIMLLVICLVIIAVAIDYLHHPPVEPTGDELDSIAGEHEAGAPCSMDGMHAEEGEEEL